MDWQVLNRVRFEPFALDNQVGPEKRYDLALDPAFPFMIKFFSYDSVSGSFSMNWHERLELFVPLSGSGVFAIGEDRVPFGAGDVLVVDNLKLHGLAEFSGWPRRAMIITFLPAFLYSLGSPICDSVFLIPFYRNTGDPPVIVPASDSAAPLLHQTLSCLVRCYLEARGEQYKAGCKAYLLETIYLLIARVDWTASTLSEHLRRQEESRRLGKLNSYLVEHFCERISVRTAASIVAMSESRFMKYFRSVTGETFVGYLTRLRVERAARLLATTHLPVAEIAAECGFSDQSYFVRVFRRHFGVTPRDFRARGPGPGVHLVAIRRRA